MNNMLKLFLIFLGASIIAFLIHPVLGIIVFALTVCPVPLWGFGADKLNDIERNKKIQQEIKLREQREKEQLERREKELVDTYGASPEDINKRIPQSENLRKIVDIILGLPYLPYEIHIDCDKIFWLIEDENGSKKTVRIYYSNYGIAPIPDRSVGTLARALASDMRIKEKYDYKYNDPEWTYSGYVHNLVLKSKYKYNNLNKW